MNIIVESDAYSTTPSEEVPLNQNSAKENYESVPRMEQKHKKEVKIISSSSMISSSSTRRSYRSTLRQSNASLGSEGEALGFGDQGVEHRMDSFDSYIVVSVLTATASFAALFELNPDGTRIAYYHDLEVVVCSLCTLLGIYATVVFSYSSTYGRTAVGTGRIQLYETFLEDTGPLRERAFKAYRWSLYMFMLLLILTAGARIVDRLQLPFVVILLGISALSYKDWKTITVAAGPIFAEEKCQKAMRKKMKESGMLPDVDCPTRYTNKRLD